MIRKILYGLLAFVVVVVAVGTFVYFRYLKPAPPPISDLDRAQITVMPLPASLRIHSGIFVVSKKFHVSLGESPKDPLVNGAIERFLAQLSAQTKTVFIPGEKPDFIIHYDSIGHAVVQPQENESYSLEITTDRIKLEATNSVGIMRGLETLLQLVIQSDSQQAFPCLEIEDRPRYSWRGILIDAGRHWITKESILRNVEAMAAVKMNVLHWHLSEYQGFRVESKVFPKLHELGSGGHYYSQKDIRDVVAFAHARGVRVVPEFDMPGHSTSWLVGYPQLGSAPGPYVLDKKFGLLAPVLDPTKEEVYTFIDSLVGEMATLFPDTYFHIGGDEVVPTAWNSNPHIQAFMKEKAFKNAHDLQNYFNKRVEAILRKHHKKMIGWDEILQSDLPKEIVVQSWRGQRPLFEAVHANRNAILSAGWYLDHKLHADKLYQVDPEVLPGAVTIDPDTLHWQVYDVDINVSESPIKAQMVLYGQEDSLRGLFGMMENYTGFPKALLKGKQLDFSFTSDYGDIDVTSMMENDSIHGKMSLGFLSFPFTGKKIGSNTMAGTKPPKVERIAPLTPSEKELILGGEAALWTELVSDLNIDTRIWPRTAAVAEKLWAPVELTKDVKDMYRRLDHLSEYLETYKGTLHEKQYAMMLTNLAEGKSLQPLQVLVDALEEVKRYDRMMIYKDLTVETPLNEVVDAALPESRMAGLFNQEVDEFDSDSSHQKHVEEIRRQLTSWRDNHDEFVKLAAGNKRLEKLIPISQSLKEASIIALEVMEQINNGTAGAMILNSSPSLKELNRPSEGVIIAVMPGIQKLAANVKAKEQITTP
jgi:hexosaminidase